MDIFIPCHASQMKIQEDQNSTLFHRVSRENNMNVVRYYLSLCVLIAHTSVLTGLDIPWIQRGVVDVGCFFAISGFLMFPSFQKRESLRHYIGRRAKRILPPYFLIVLLCAFSFVLISDLPTADYFTSADFWKYLAANLTFLNFIHPDLPGVFDGPEFVMSAVNGSLWTMKGEWVCYMSVPLAYYVVKKHPRQAGAIFTGIFVSMILVRLVFLHLAVVRNSEFYAIIAKQFGTLLVFFYLGAIINLYFPLFLRLKWWILGFDFLVLLLSDHIPYYDVLLQPVVAGTLVIWFSMIGKWGAKLSRHDSVSYDIYLYHFPVVQLVVLWGLPQKVSPLMVLLTVIGITVPFAFLSWNLIGKRFKNS